MKCSPMFVLFLEVLATSLTLAAQSPPALDADKGFTEIETVQGTLNSTDRLMKIDSMAGYDFNKHFGVFAGLPIYFANVSGGTTTGTTGAMTGGGSNAGVGNFYLGLAFRAPNPAVNYGSTITAGAPTGSTRHGFSSGRGTIDWSNHFDRSFSRLTPFLDAGLANTVPDSLLVTRPFTSLGAVGHFEEGAEFELAHHFAVAGSGYEITPFGNQKVFSKLLQPGQTRTTTGKSHGVFENTFASSGDGLTRENGFSTALSFQPSQIWRAELGYTHSATFATNSFSFNLALNMGKMFRARKTL